MNIFLVKILRVDTVVWTRLLLTLTLVRLDWSGFKSNLKNVCRSEANIYRDICPAGYM